MATRAYLTTGSAWAEAYIEDESMPDDMSAWAASAATACGVPSFEVVIVADGDPDPRTGELISEIAQPAPFEEPAPSPFRQLREALIADPSLAPETKAALAAIAGGAIADTEVPMVPQKG